MWFTFDVFGIALSLLTWVLFAFTDCVVCMNVLVTLFGAPDPPPGEPVAQPRIPWLPPWLRFTTAGNVVFFSYQFILLLALLSHLQAMTTDPGTVTESQPPQEFQNNKFCKLCEDRWKPPRAHHCKTCRRCIFRMDHHCPWVNNCVGFANQKYFILFLGWTIASCIATLLLLVCGLIYWLAVQKSMAEASPPGSVGLLICSGLVCLVCLGGTIFVSDFLQEQVESIQLNSTLVETYQRTHGKQTNFWDHFRGVFGHQWWLWPLPCKTTPAPDYTEPAIPDDADRGGMMSHFPEEDNLGIAGSEHEERFKPSMRSPRSPVRPTAATWSTSTTAAGTDDFGSFSDRMNVDSLAPRQPGSAPRPRHRYGGGEASEPVD